ncbi:MAG: hypothetical protein JO340_05100 [Acidobacteriaceae bacterium]|nr:hypothetical protein [Acidobacteriaceae bacterium]
MFKRVALGSAIACLAAFGQEAPASSAPPAYESTVKPSPTQASAPPAQNPGGFKRREEAQPAGPYQIAAGTHVLLNMINSVSTKQAQPGDRLYLETAFPVLSGPRIVIPQGSWVTGTITEVKRPGRVKGRGELQVRFDSLTLPNGITRNFRSDLGALDARNGETLKREESKVTGPGDKKTDVGTVIGTTTAGTVIGSGVGAAAGNVARGAGIGAGAGAAAGLLGVLLTRGPEAMLPRGSTVEMVLDRPLTFEDADLDFSKAPEHAALPEGSPAQRESRGLGSHFPY